MSFALICCSKSYLVKNTNREVEEGDRYNNTEQTSKTKKRAATAPVNDEE